MINIQSLTIKKFRGIKELTIPLQGKSWVIHGRNGSGKSGVVDAIEFALSGEIGRLSGEGRGDVSVKAHGPHVDFKDSPKSASVEIELKIGSDNKTLKVMRDCSNPSKFTTVPATGIESDLFKSYSTGRELVLSRREVLRFVLSEPGKRSKEVQTLLQISKIDEIRTAFQSVRNKAERSSASEKQEFDRKKDKLKEWLEVEELNKETILEVINKHRIILGLDSILLLDESTQVSVGEKQSDVTKKFLNKDEIYKDLSAIEVTLLDTKNAFSIDVKKFSDLYLKISEKKSEIKELKKMNFYELGLPLINGDFCPFCENEWEEDELRTIISDKITEISGIKKIQTEILSSMRNIQGHWKTGHDSLVSFLAKIAGTESLKSTELTKIKNELDKKTKIELTNIEAYYTETANVVGLCLNNLDLLKVEIMSLKEEISKLPEKSLEEKSKEFLIVCQERLNSYWESKRKFVYQNSKFKIADKMLNSFNSIVEVKLNSLYDDVQKDFSRFYQIVNQDDESSFAGDLVADKGALDFKVNFYDRGKFPPAAYHSEGHQDGMGLCLYLALMKKILGANFTLAILDDVLMSVDSDHRKSFCKLLKNEFPNTQFIITTHDEYWKKQMITEGLINHSTALHFKKWSVDNGPSVWDEKDSWTEVEQFMDDENIPSASHSLRRYLEYFMDEMSVRVSASIPRSASGDHDLGELLSGVTSRFGELLKKAKNAARSWGNSELESSYENEKKEFDECLAKARSETWAMNAVVHFNSWASMGKNDFKEIRDAYFKLTQKFKCDKCLTLLHVIPLKGASESLKCDCGSRTYNLKVK